MYIKLLVFYSQKINEKQQVVNEYESGKAIPNNAIMSKLERNLGMYIVILNVKTGGLQLGAGTIINVHTFMDKWNRKQKYVG